MDTFCFAKGAEHLDLSLKSVDILGAQDFIKLGHLSTAKALLLSTHGK